MRGFATDCCPTLYTRLHEAPLIRSNSCSFLVCTLGATVTTFEDIPNQDIDQGQLPTNYGHLSWTHCYYINSTRYPTSGYRFALASGEMIAWFNATMTIAALKNNQTFTLNSFVMAAGWSDSYNLTIVGYNSSIPLYTTIVLVYRYNQTLVILDWSGIDKIAMTPSRGGNIDTGIDNLCITF